ncbi:hypothetical protein BT96DRAFT_999451 [Gymnopus androsaceus JB14]|uniref:Peptidase A1 domain-containing protein n=1 Tax=Gymnopus androsaceus JB14 TaxID=1447944 RepID=A0A6A4H7V5_9AGAR|nr:hypothetical protein BT96DRAFT_999451 [Gymnopus androsaceus JB14]
MNQYPKLALYHLYPQFDFTRSVLAASGDIDHSDLSAIPTGTGTRILNFSMCTPIHHAPASSIYRRKRDVLCEDLQGAKCEEGPKNGVQVPLNDFIDVTFMSIGNTTTIPVVIAQVPPTFGSYQTCVSPQFVHARSCYLPNPTPNPEEKYHSTQNLPATPNPIRVLEDGSLSFNSTFFPASLLYDDSLTGTHTFDVIGTDSAEIGTGTGPTPTTDLAVFDAINDTNTSVLEAQCAGILRMEFPLNSALYLKVFEGSHFQSSHFPAHRPPDVNYKRTHDGHQRRRDLTENTPLNRRTFPDLSRFFAGVLESEPEPGISILGL